jgi:hypothetical protein
MALTPEQIADRFDISLSAARIRAEELDRMASRALGKKRPLPASIADFLRDQKRKGFNVTSVDSD